MAKRGYTAEDVLSILDGNNSDFDELSDNDSDNENLPDSDYTAGSSQDSDDSENEEFDSSDDEPLSSVADRIPKKKKPTKGDTYKFERRSFIPPDILLSLSLLNQHQQKTYHPTNISKDS